MDEVAQSKATLEQFVTVLRNLCSLDVICQLRSGDERQKIQRWGLD